MVWFSGLAELARLWISEAPAYGMLCFAAVKLEHVYVAVLSHPPACCNADQPTVITSADGVTNSPCAGGFLTWHQTVITLQTFPEVYKPQHPLSSMLYKTLVLEPRGTTCIRKAVILLGSVNLQEPSASACCVLQPQLLCCTRAAFLHHSTCQKPVQPICATVPCDQDR